MGSPNYPPNMPKGVKLWLSRNHVKGSSHPRHYLTSLEGIHLQLGLGPGHDPVFVTVEDCEGQARVYPVKGGYAAKYPDEPGEPIGRFKTVAGALDDAYRMLIQSLNPCGPYPPAGISRWQIHDPVAGFKLDDDITLFTMSYRNFLAGFAGGCNFAPVSLKKAARILRGEGKCDICVKAKGTKPGSFVRIRRTGKKTPIFTVTIPWDKGRESFREGGYGGDFKSLQTALTTASEHAQVMPRPKPMAKKVV